MPSAQRYVTEEKTQYDTPNNLIGYRETSIYQSRKILQNTAGINILFICFSLSLIQVKPTKST